VVPALQLWLPILLSAVAVFAVSPVIHTLLPWHRGRWAATFSLDGVIYACVTAGFFGGLWP